MPTRAFVLANGTRLDAQPPRSVAQQTGGFFWFPGLETDASGRVALFVDEHDDSNTLPLACSLWLAPSKRAAFTEAARVDADQGSGTGHPCLTVGTGFGRWEINPRPVPNNGTPVSVFSADLVTYIDGGAEFTRQNGASTITLAGTVEPFADHGGGFYAYLFWYGGKAITALNGDLLSTLYYVPSGGSIPADFRTVLIASADGGVTWTERGTIATPADVPLSTEGANETAIVCLSDGTLLAAVRANGGGNGTYLFSSADSGVTWSLVGPIANPPGGGFPSLHRLTNGRIVYATGAGPTADGMQLGFATEAAAKLGNFAPWSISDFHRAEIGPFASREYVTLREVEPNVLLVAYDALGATNQIYLVELAVSTP